MPPKQPGSGRESHWLHHNQERMKALTIQADLDLGSYPKGIEISDEEMSRVQLTPATFHGEWNYTITSRKLAPL